MMLLPELHQNPLPTCCFWSVPGGHGRWNLCVLANGSRFLTCEGTPPWLMHMYMTSTVGAFMHLGKSLERAMSYSDSISFSGRVST